MLFSFSPFRLPAWGLALTALAALSGCASAPPTQIQGPVAVRPVEPPTYIERVETGSLFNPNATSLFSGREKPRRVGDMLKVDIAESLKASSQSSTDASRNSALNSKGPGSGAGAFFADLLNQDVSASGSSSFKGGGTSGSTSSVATQITTRVIQVLPNGHLVVAGERALSLHGNGQVMRFAGVVDPWDIAADNVVKSASVANAQWEVVGQGDVAEATRRNWLQRVLARTLAIW